jgi:8-oxo-dGTP diphosphatase
MRLSGKIVGVAGIIRRGDRVLLTKRSRLIAEGGKWCLPGGQVKKFEHAEDAVTREVKEEVGLSTRKARLLFAHEEFLRRLHLHAVVFTFVLETTGEPKANWEVSQMGWFTKKEIEKLDMAFTHKDILRKYFGGKK